MREVTFTVDVEDPRPNDRLPRRYDRVTRQILDLLEPLNIQGTFFFVGKLADADPGLVREVAGRGHEIALHSYDHIPLPQLSPEQFRRDTEIAKGRLEEICGQAVRGYRAPIFSLTRESLWATDMLAELGFAYSSSVLPVANPFYGYPGAPRQPFRWPSGLLELPAPVARIGPLLVPYLGGIYFRYLPHYLIRRGIGRAAAQSGLWLYSHPHDFDAGEGFYRIRNTSWWVSLLLWGNRRHTFRKFRALLTDSAAITVAPPFAGQLDAGKFDGVALFQP